MCVCVCVCVYIEREFHIYIYIGFTDISVYILYFDPSCLSFPCGSAGKESTCNAGDLGSIPGLGRSPGEGNGYPPQYSGLENSMDYMVHGVTKSWTQLCNFHFHFLLASLVAQRLKHLPAMRETGVRSLGSIPGS